MHFVIKVLYITLQDAVADEFLKSIDWGSTTETCKSMNLTTLLSKHARPELDLQRVQQTFCHFNLTPAVENKTTPLGQLSDAVNDLVLWNIDWVIMIFSILVRILTISLLV